MKNKKNEMILLMIVAVLVIVLIVMCVTKSMNKKPEKAVNSFIENLKVGDFNTAKTYTSDNTMDALEIGTNVEELEMVKYYFKYIDVKVLEVTKSSNQAIVKAEIKNKDLKAILQNYIKKALEISLEQINSTNKDESIEDQLLNYFIAQFEAQEIENVTTTVDIVLNKVDGKWKVVIDKTLRDALLPGLSEINNLYTIAA